MTLTSAPQVVGGRYNPTPGAVITGRAALGEVLTADDSAPWSDLVDRGEPILPAVHTYRWLRDGVAIPGATALKYTITAEDLGKTLVLHTEAGPFSAESLPVVVPGPIPVPVPVPVELRPLTNKTSPVLTGDAVTGTPMTVTTGAWSLPGDKLTHTYTWFSADGKVVGNGPSFTPGKDLVGKKLNVLVAAIAPGYTTAWVRIIATKPVTAPDPTQTTAPAVMGSPIVGKKISVSGGVWSDRDSEVKRAFQWLRNGAKITGATGSAYTAVGADLGKTLSVTVTSALDGRSLKSQTVVARARPRSEPSALAHPPHWPSRPWIPADGEAGRLDQGRGTEVPLAEERGPHRQRLRRHIPNPDGRQGLQDHSPGHRHFDRLHEGSTGQRSVHRPLTTEGPAPRMLWGAGHRSYPRFISKTCRFSGRSSPLGPAGSRARSTVGREHSSLCPWPLQPLQPSFRPGR